MNEICNENWPQNPYGLGEVEFESFLNHISGCPVHEATLCGLERQIEVLIDLGLNHKARQAVEDVSVWSDAPDAVDITRIIDIRLETVPGGSRRSDLFSTALEFADTLRRFWIPYWFRIGFESRGAIIAVIIAFVGLVVHYTKLQYATPAGERPAADSSTVVSTNGEPAKGALHLVISAHKSSAKDDAPSRIFNETVSSRPPARTASERRASHRFESGRGDKVKGTVQIEVTIVNPNQDFWDADLSFFADESTRHLCSAQFIQKGKCILRLEDRGDYDYEIQGKGYLTTEVDIETCIDTNTPKYVTLEKITK